jgi:MFS family permease
MTVSAAIVATARAPATVETRGSWIVCLSALGIAAVSFAAPAILVVGLKSIAADLGDGRSVPALAYSLAWLGASFGGIPMGRVAERFGIRSTVIFGAVMIAVGLIIAQRGGRFGLLVGYGVFVGLLGNSGINAPLYVYVSRWFDRRRGTALALLGSGSSVSAAIWAPIFVVAEAHVGWRHTMLGFAALEVVLILPAATLFFGPAPETAGAEGDRHGPQPGAPVLGLKPTIVLSGLCTAGFLCCVPMAMPQGHLVAFCSDVGIPASQGAAMLSVLLGCAFVSRPALGLCRRPDRRLADDPCRLGVPDHRDDRFSADAERGRAVRRLGLVRTGLQRHHPGLWCASCSRRAKRHGGFRASCCSAVRAWRLAVGSPARSTIRLASMPPPSRPVSSSISRT